MPAQRPAVAAIRSAAVLAGRGRCVEPEPGAHPGPFAPGAHAGACPASTGAAKHPELLHPADYAHAQAAGARIHREGHPGLLIQSVRRAGGENVAVLNPGVLSNPTLICQLTYRLKGGRIIVEKRPGVAWMRVDVASI